MRPTQVIDFASIRFSTAYNNNNNTSTTTTNNNNINNNSFFDLEAFLQVPIHLQIKK